MATPDPILSALQTQKIRDTQPRRLVVEALRKLGKPASVQDIQKYVRSKGNAINGVTVYRVVALLDKHKLIHRHPCGGLLTLCTMPEMRGHHGFLHCTSCESVKEFIDADLCAAENRVAQQADFLSHRHVSEILGVCKQCHA